MQHTNGSGGNIGKSFKKSLGGVSLIEWAIIAGMVAVVGYLMYISQPSVKPKTLTGGAECFQVEVVE